MNQEITSFCNDFIKNRFMAVGSCVSNNEPRSFTFWYKVLNGKIYWKSRTESIHSKAFQTNPIISLCIYDHNAAYPDDKTGVQIIGTVTRIIDKEEMKQVVDSFAHQFGEKVYIKNNLDDLCNEHTQSTFYLCIPKKIKLVSKELGIHSEEYEEFSLLV